MRSPLADIFDETLGYSFGKAVLEMLGPRVQASIFDLLERRGIEKRDVSNRFDDVVQVLTTYLGNCSRVMIYKTVVEMFKEYSQRLDFSYTDSLKDRLAVLKEAVVSNHLFPRRLSDESMFDNEEIIERSASSNAPKGEEYSSLYRLKRGLKTPST